jgi:hypothetical protein
MPSAEVIERMVSGLIAQDRTGAAVDEYLSALPKGTRLPMTVRWMLDNLSASPGPEVKAWDPSKHPREAAGSGSHGGEFAPAAGGGGGGGHPTLDSLGIKPTKDYESAATNNRLDAALREAREQGTPGHPEQVIAAVEANEKKFLDGAQVKTNVPFQAFEDIFGSASGRFENQHEVGSSEGIFDPQFRAQVEHNAFSVNSYGSPDEFPKYGYMDNPTSPNPDFGGKRYGGSDDAEYGAVQITFKDAVRDRTTVTFGDSLDPMDNKSVLPTPANKPDYRAVQGGLHMMSNPQQRVDDINAWYGYVEAQIHGPDLTVDDVASVHLTRAAKGSGSEPTQARVEQLLTDKGFRKVPGSEQGGDEGIWERPEGKTWQDLLADKAWDPSKHPREAAGSGPHGGEFASGGGAGGGAHPTLDSLGIKPSASLERTATRRMDEAIRWRAAAHGQTPKEMQADIENKMDTFLKGAKVRMNVPLGAVQRIFAPGGKFENQLETGTSRGSYNPAGRKAAEADGFGVTSDRADDHPKYGYADNPSAKNDLSAAYGGVQITFKDSVKDRTTVTFGDSLYALMKNSVLPMPMKGPSDYRATTDVDALTRGTATPKEINRELGYVEAQIHGPNLTAADVESVHFYPKNSAVAHATQSGDIARYRKLVRDAGVKIV